MIDDLKNMGYKYSTLASVSFSIEEGTFCDVFGNENNAFEAENAYFYSYGYTYDDVVGTYSGTATSYWYGPYETTMTLEEYAPESEEDPAGNVAITEFAGLTCDFPIIGTFNFHTGTLTIPNEQVFGLKIPDYVYDEEGNVVFGEDEQPLITSFTGVFMNASDSTPVTLQMPVAGTLTNPSTLFGIYGVWENGDEGWYDVFKGFDVQKDTAVEPVLVKRMGRRSL